jgi:hypothetical protein
VTEPLRRPMGGVERLIDGRLQPVELEENQALRGVVSKRERPDSVSARFGFVNRDRGSSITR